MSVDKSKWRVAFTKRAEEDIREIFSFLVGREGTEIAENILNTFVQARDKLSIFPEQGRIPPELSRVNIFSYREIQAHPYRIIYQVNKPGREIYIHVVADSRCNFTELLKKRLLNTSIRKTLLQ